MMNLFRKEEDNSQALKRGYGAKEFLESDFFREFLLPYMDKERMAYPDPSKKGWEDQYRLAHAKDKVYVSLMQTVNAWKSEAERITKEKNEPEKDISLA